MKIRAAISRDAGGAFQVEEVELCEPIADEVLVRLVGVGICHTDLAAHAGVFPIALPAVLGHEGAGIVVSVGEGVDHVSPGDHVLLSFSSCSECSACLDNRPTYCRNFLPLNFLGKRLDGTTALSSASGAVSSHFFGQSSFGTYAIARSRSVIKVDRDAPLEMLGPLGCGIQTGAGAVLRSLQCRPGRSIAILGGGAVGLSAVMAARIADCASIVVVDHLPTRLDMALKLGATAAVDATGQDLATALKETAPAGFDYIVDTTGVASIIEHALAALGHNGKMGLIGSPSRADAMLHISHSQIMNNGQSVQGIIMGDSDGGDFIRELLDHHRAGRFPFDQLIKTFAFENINEAIAEQKAGGCVKVVLLMPSAPAS